ncbi:hypothetical protein ACFOMD_02485 [Sphingoaurantiacus capsulatus]|uniref:Uncharacterized protein n=1 Tax=Sphingoaurantiacus capsulatus TaxID=1771310 RepID=A0ABV7X5J8_9SPHN
MALNYTTEEFWRARLPTQKPISATPLAGWETEVPPLDTFVEAPLTQSEAFGEDVDPWNSPLILVSAAGAVGKSTLARQIASQTGAVYVDLAKADPVGGYTLSGGLLKSGVLDAWRADAAALLIDGLDEARLKVTKEGFEAFLKDVAQLCAGRSTPTVLFGRTGAVQDAWLNVASSVPVAVLEIGYYPPEAAVDFAFARLAAAKPDYAFADAGRRAIEALLDGLRKDTTNDGDRFAGYAPVLEAVANRVAVVGNPNALLSQVSRGEQPVTLKTIIEAILEREQAKLHSMVFEDTNLRQSLYQPGEQMERLVARVYGRVPPVIPAMSAKDVQTYSNALETWVPDHPFLDGGRNAASAVFEAVVTAHALQNPNTGGAAAQAELAKGAAANPFLAEFYLGAVEKPFIPPEHVGFVYASLRARLSLGDSASLSIDGVEAAEDSEQLKAEVEINLQRAGEEAMRILQFRTEQTGVLRLGTHVEDVEVVAPLARVEIGGAREAMLVAPVSIQCGNLEVDAERIIAENAPGISEGAIILQADSAEVSLVASVPTLNGNVKLAVNWAGAEAYPWTSFRSNPTKAQDPKVDEGLRRFRKFVIAFRSHSKGALKRYAGKIEHERMTKGTGRAVLDHMLATGILSTDGSMYTLDADALAAVAGSSYVATMASNYPDKTLKFIAEAVNADN